MKKAYTGSIGGALLLFMLFAAPVAAATLSLSPAAREVPAGETFTVDVMLDTEGEAVDGVDLHFLNFNPAHLEVVDADVQRAGVQIQPGALFSVTAMNRVYNSSGTIVFSQVALGPEAYRSEEPGALATVTFKAVSNGTSEVVFDSADGETRDSNVAAGGRDVLRRASGGTYGAQQRMPLLSLLYEWAYGIFDGVAALGR